MSLDFNFTGLRHTGEVEGAISISVGGSETDNLPLSLRVLSRYDLPPGYVRGVEMVRGLRQRVFVSYSRRDASVVERCERLLAQFGVKFVRDVRDFDSGEPLSATIKKSIFDETAFTFSGRKTRPSPTTSGKSTFTRSNSVGLVSCSPTTGRTLVPNGRWSSATWFSRLCPSQEGSEAERSAAPAPIPWPVPLMPSRRYLSRDRRHQNRTRRTPAGCRTEPLTAPRPEPAARHSRLAGADSGTSNTAHQPEEEPDRRTQRHRDVMLAPRRVREGEAHEHGHREHGERRGGVSGVTRPRRARGESDPADRRGVTTPDYTRAEGQIGVTGVVGKAKTPVLAGVFSFWNQCQCGTLAN